MKEEKTPKKINKWIVFTSMPFQMAATIYLCYFIGDWIDVRFDFAGGWWAKGFTMLGVVASMYQFIRQAKHISKDE